MRSGDPILDATIGERNVFEGVVTGEPDERENHVRLSVHFDTAASMTTDSGVLVITEAYPVFRYGDRLQLSGVLERPDNFSSEDGREFNYVQYLAKEGIFYEMAFPDIERIATGQGNPVKTILFSLKHHFLAKVETLIPEPESSLLGGLVLGAKQSLGKELQDDFRTVGIIHIVVLSGYNVTIVAEAIMRVFSFLPFLAGLSVGAIVIVLFAIMTGASATIVRASVMALLVLLARATGREYDVLRALFLAGFFMVLANPRILAFDPSFQLSFLASIGLISIAPRIERFATAIPQRFHLREFAVATVATQLFVLPLLLFSMGEFSLVALPVNLLVLIVVPAAMLLGFLTGMVAFISATVALPFAGLTYMLLAYQLRVVDLFSSLPFASVHLPQFPFWIVIVWYGLYGLLIVRHLHVSHRVAATS
jgi:competence protein ComEC